ncbi:MAG: 2-keto-4-pentenoate hydratase/2-oxohepta-3-ene-1,7-dioic acid hydratase in catechol pathway [Planctomycetota bacterium]|jgi:2-keto-4-pentenoate hydratase/2-oxohepta-3-ene-1,7-dioic acid hydratase in catechol pathway
MKLATFKIKSKGTVTIGGLVGDSYVDLHALSDGALPGDMIEFLKGGDAAMDRARALLAEPESAKNKGCAYTADEIELMAPVPQPGKIVHTSCNFDAHLEELSTWEDSEWQSHNWQDFHFEHPTGFLQAGSSVCAHNTGVSIPKFTKQLDFEIEIGIVIGKEAFEVSSADAMNYVAGYTIFNDLSARDIQAREHSNKVILMGKSFKNSCPLGPLLVTPDDLSDPHNLEMTLRLNGEARQESNTGAMHYKTAELVSWWSMMGLYPGDVITSGSPPGVIAGMKNPEWLKPGDVVEATVAELGVLTVNVI